MKHIIFAFLAVFLLISCAKENKMEDTDFDLQTRSELTPGQLASGFSQIVHGSFDPTRTFAASDAILGVETLLNYEYSNITGGYHEVFTLRDTFVVDKRNGMIDDNVVQDIYDETLRRISCHYLGVADTSRMQLYTDLNLINENSTQIELAVVNAVALLSPPGFPPAWPWKFYTGDEWRADYGKCDQPHPSSGSKEVEKRVNWNVGVNSVEYGEWYSHPQREIYCIYGFWCALNPNDLVPGDCILDYNIWMAHTGCPEAIYCLDYLELNFYLVNAQYDAKRVENIIGKRFINMEINYRRWEALNAGNIPESWEGIGTYMTRNIDIYRTIKVFSQCDQNP